MIIAEAVSSAGNVYNEDLIRYDDHYVLLLDGSTGLADNYIDGYPTDAVWFVTAVSDYIHAHVHPYEEPAILISDLVIHLNHAYRALHTDKVERINLPSASMVLIRETYSGIEVINIGDCTTLVETMAGDVQIIHDDRVSKMDGLVVKKMKSLSCEMSMSIRETFPLIMEDLITNRNRKNTGDGYPIVGFEKPTAIDIKRYKKSDIRRMYLYSDGVADHYETLQISKDAYDFYHRIRNVDLHTIVSEIRDRQDNDLSCDHYPRLKARDDASIVLVEFN